MIVAGCRNNSNQAKKQVHSFAATTTKKAIPVKNISDLQGDTTIVADEFSSGVLAFKVFRADTNKIKSLFLDPAVLKTGKGTNQEGGSFDLYDFTDGINKIELYGKNDEFYIEDADIKNNKVLLNKKISIGMEKETFLALLKVNNIKCDTIIAVNDESTFESVYIFKNEQLHQLKMGQMVE